MYQILLINKLRFFWIFANSVQILQTLTSCSNSSLLLIFFFYLYIIIISSQFYLCKYFLLSIVFITSEIKDKEQLFLIIQIFQYLLEICQDSKLSSCCNLGKDLRKDKRNDQLVKYKNKYLYLLLYIPNDYNKCIWHP